MRNQATYQALNSFSGRPEHHDIEDIFFKKLKITVFFTAFLKKLNLDVVNVLQPLC